MGTSLIVTWHITHEYAKYTTLVGHVGQYGFRHLIICIAWSLGTGGSPSISILLAANLVLVSCMRAASLE